MEKIKCIVIEDEPLATRLLCDYIRKVPQLELCGTFKDALTAGHLLQQTGIDLIFLDIHLPRLKGFSFLRTLYTKPAIIVTTAYHQYAVEGFELNVCDYLMKPFSFERFLAALNKINRPPEMHPLKDRNDSKNEKTLFLSIDRKRVRINFENILYIESQREYVKVITLNEEYVSKISTAEIECLLPKERFARVHRSFIVAVAKIDAYTKGKIEINGRSIPIGKGFKTNLLSYG